MLPLCDVTDGLALIICFRFRGGFAPCTAHDAVTLHRNCCLQSVLLVGLLDKKVPEVTWMCSPVRVSTPKSSQWLQQKTLKLTLLNIRFDKTPKNQGLGA